MSWTESDYVLWQARRGAVVHDTAVPDISENTFLSRILREASRYGWLFYHTRDSRGSAKGFPDLVLVKPARQTAQDAPGSLQWENQVVRDSQGTLCDSPGILGGLGRGRVIFAELKKQTGKLTQEQATWLSVLRQTGLVETYLWRPVDWEAICAVLRDSTGSGHNSEESL